MGDLERLLHPAIGHSALDTGDLTQAILVSGHNIVAGNNVMTASLFGLLPRRQTVSHFSGSGKGRLRAVRLLIDRHKWARRWQRQRSVISGLSEIHTSAVTGS